MLPTTEAPFPSFFDLNGEPLDEGSVYYGVANTNPVTSPIPVFWDIAGTQPAAQPVKTLAGYQVRFGTPSNVYTDDPYSISVYDKKGRLVFTHPDSSQYNQLPTFIDDLASETDATKGSALVGYKYPGAAGAVGRTVSARLSDFASVKDFGAKGDGATDDSAAIQRAIDETSGVVFFPPGTYRLDTGLAWTKSGVHLVGAGIGATTLSCTFNTADIISIGDGVANPNNTTVTGMSITSTVARTAGAAVRVQNGHAIHISHIRLDNNMYYGFRFDGGAQQFIYKLTDFEINSGFVGILVGQTGTVVQDLFINRGVIANCTSSGLLLLNASGVNAMHTDVIGCATGLATFPAVGQEVRYLFFTQMVMDTCVNNGWFFTANGGTVAEVTLDNCWGSSNGTGGGAGSNSGIYIDATSGACRAFAISACRFLNNQGNGIHLGNSLNVTISNCHCIANSQVGSALFHGMFVEPNVSLWSVSGGVFGNNGIFGAANLQGYGIACSGTSDNFVIEGALVAGNVTGGISDTSSGTQKYIASNPGFRTSNQGAAQIIVGQTAVVVNHNLSVTPQGNDIQVTFTTSPGASGVVSCYITAVTATTFTIGVNTAVVGNPVFLGWSVRTKGA